MRTTKRTRITFESEQVLIIQQRSSNRRWCPGCCRVVEMVPFAQAAALAGVSPVVLRDHAQAAQWHMAEAQDGTPMICLDSLLKGQADSNQVEQDKKRDP